MLRVRGRLMSMTACLPISFAPDTLAKPGSKCYFTLYVTAR